MSGIEIAVAVFGIIGGLANACKLVLDLRDRRKKKNEKAAEIERLDKLVESLRQAEMRITGEYKRLHLRPSGELLTWELSCSLCFSSSFQGFWGSIADCAVCT
jgi:hypothetical protein